MSATTGRVPPSDPLLESTMQDVPLSLARLLSHATTMHGGAEVLTWDGGDFRRATFAQLGDDAARLARALREFGIGRGDRVATLMWNSYEHMVAYGAIPAMGAVVHTLNVRLSAEQLRFVLADGGATVVLVDADLLPLLTAALDSTARVARVVVVGDVAAPPTLPDGVAYHAYSEMLGSRSARFDWPILDERAPAAICHTSGTTGDPKGVVYSHRSIWLHSMFLCTSEGFRIAEGDSILAIVPMFHVLCWGLPYAALMVGASLVMPGRFLQSGPLLEMLRIARPTIAAGVPSIWKGLQVALDAAPQDLSHLREAIVGGATCAPSLMRRLSVDHGVELTHAWGMTETSPVGTISHPPAGASPEHAWSYRVTQGRFPALVEARLVADDGSTQPFDDASVGELEVRGPWITRTYLTSAEQSADGERFRDGWLRTGDVGRISADGFLTLVDRTKDMIKSGGEWISSVELENHVLAHPDVSEVAVIGVPDERWSERPLVIVVLVPGSTATAEELRGALIDKVARWQLPERWAFVTELPKTGVGKLNKRLLRSDYASDAFEIVLLAPPH